MALTFGNAGMPANWGVASPLFNYSTGKFDSGGMIWMGREACTPADKEALKAKFGPAVQIDTRSLVGMNSPKYATFQSVNQGKGQYKQAFVVKGKKK